MSNDWIKWNWRVDGDEMPNGPVRPIGTVYDVIYRDGTAQTGTFEGDGNWIQTGDRNDIVSYRISDTQTKVDLAKPCLCFPGQCRGQVVDGKQPNGDRCKEDYAKSDEAWFEWDTSMLPTHPGMVCGHFAMEWELVSGHKARGAARDPAWFVGGPHRVIRYRWTDPRVMLLNPYTGQKRNAVDIMQDPEGRLVRPTQAFYNAEIAAQVTATGQAALKALGDALNSLDDSMKVELITDPAEIESVFERDQEAEGAERVIAEAAMAPAMTAPDLLDAAAGHMKARAATYDKPEGERSMGATVEAFNAITGRDLRESEGWLLMTLLKLVRSETRDAPHRDSVEDLIAYSGLYGEARPLSRKWKDKK